MSTPADTGDRLRRTGYGLSAAAAAATVFAIAPANDAVRLVAVPVVVVPVLLVLAAVGVTGTALRRPVAFAVAGAGGLATGLLQAVQFGRDVDWLGGNGSTAAFLGAIGIGFLGLFAAVRAQAHDPARPGRD